MAGAAHREATQQHSKKHGRSPASHPCKRQDDLRQGPERMTAEQQLSAPLH